MPKLHRSIAAVLFVLVVGVSTGTSAPSTVLAGPGPSICC